MPATVIVASGPDLYATARNFVDLKVRPLSGAPHRARYGGTAGCRFATGLRTSPNVVPTPKSPDSTDNRLLASLPAPDRRRMCGREGLVELSADDTLASAGALIQYVYFPLDSFISLIAPVGGRAQFEVGLIGNEGMLGASLLLGPNIAPLRAVVHGAGLAWRVEAATFVRELDRCSALRHGVNRYLFVLVRQLAQTSACARFHLIDARLARWLLMARDRSRSSKLRVTHEILAQVLGVRRVGVTVAASKMRTSKLVRYTRGSLEILDAHRLEAIACECYSHEKASYASTFDSADGSSAPRPRRPSTKRVR